MKVLSDKECLKFIIAEDAPMNLYPVCCVTLVQVWDKLSASLDLCAIKSRTC